MNLAPYIHRAWLISFLGYCLSLTFAIAYSHVFAGVALIFLFLDLLHSKTIRFSVSEKRLYTIIGLYVSWEILSALVNNSGGRSLWTLKEEWLFLFIPLALRALRAICQERWRETFLIALALSTIVLGLYGWLQHFFLLNLRPDYALIIMPDGFARASGAFHNTLTYGNLFALLSAMFVTLALFASISSMRWLYGLAGILAGGATVFTYSRGSVIALAVGLTLAAALSLKISRRLALGVFVVMIVSGALLAPKILNRFQAAVKTESYVPTLREKSVSRITIWSTTLEMIAERPLFGVGPGNFYDAYVRTNPDLAVHFSHAHNDTLNIAAYAGIPAAALYLSIWGYLLHLFFREVIRRKPDSPGAGILAGCLVGMVVFFVGSQTEAAFSDEEVRSVLMILWGFALWSLNPSSETSTNPPIQAQ